MKNLFLKNGHVVDPANKINEVKDIWIEDSKFKHEKHTDDLDEYETIDLSGKYILPGLVDLRCHVRNVTGGGEENIKSISKVASSGGYTTLLVMPNISPYADTPSAIRYIRECAEKNVTTNILLAGALTKKLEGGSLSPIGSLKDSGVSVITDCPYSTQNNEIFVKGIEYAAMFDLPVFEFPREYSLSKEGNAHDGSVALSMGLGGFPSMAEEIFVQRAITVSKHLDAHIHLSSISSRGSVELIREAKEKEILITADTTPAHLNFTDERIKNYRTNFKTHPPLREEEDRKALLDGLIEGTIDCICSAHEPHQEHLKHSEFDQAPAGVTSLDTCLTAVYEAFSERADNIPYKLAEWLSFNPAKIIKSNKGSLSAGISADFTVLDFNKSFQYDVSKSLSLSSNNPFDGHLFAACVEKTFIAGNLVYETSY